MTIEEFNIQDALGSLSNDDKIALVDNSNTPTDILTILSKDKNRYVRCEVAENPNTSTEILTTLSKDEAIDVRYWAVRNPNYRNNCD